MFFRRSTHPSEIDLSAYVDGELDAPHAQRVRGHIETCLACREAVEALGETKALTAALPQYAVPRAFTLSAAQAGMQAKPVARPNALRFAPAMALAVLAILVVVDIATPGTSTSVSTANHALVAKSSAESADSAAGKTLDAPNAGFNTQRSAGDSSAGGTSSTASSAGAAVVPPSAAAPSVGGLPAPSAPSTQSQAGSSASPPQIQSFSAPVAPGPAPAPALPPGVPTPTTIQPFSAQTSGAPGLTTPVPQAAGGAGSAGASPVAPIPPQAGALVPVPLLPSPAPATDVTVVVTQHHNRTLLRVLEVLAAGALIASLLVFFWPRLTGKERYQ